MILLKSKTSFFTWLKVGYSKRASTPKKNMDNLTCITDSWSMIQSHDEWFKHISLGLWTNRDSSWSLKYQMQTHLYKQTIQLKGERSTNELSLIKILIG